jgi:hypothetical protein
MNFLFDCDNIIFNWCLGFSNFMKEKHGKTIIANPSDYGMSESFNTKEEFIAYVWEATGTPGFIENLPVLDASVEYATALLRLHQHTPIFISSILSFAKDAPDALRIDNERKIALARAIGVDATERHFLFSNRMKMNVIERYRNCSQGFLGIAEDSPEIIEFCKSKDIKVFAPARWNYLKDNPVPQYSSLAYLVSSLLSSE